MELLAPLAEATHRPRTRIVEGTQHEIRHFSVGQIENSEKERKVGGNHTTILLLHVLGLNSAKPLWERFLAPAASVPSSSLLA